VICVQDMCQLALLVAYCGIRSLLVWFGAYVLIVCIYDRCYCCWYRRILEIFLDKILHQCNQQLLPMLPVCMDNLSKLTYTGFSAFQFRINMLAMTQHTIYWCQWVTVPGDVSPDKIYVIGYMRPELKWKLGCRYWILYDISVVLQFNLFGLHTTDDILHWQRCLKCL
jgi:hypothetical protein